VIRLGLGVVAALAIGAPQFRSAVDLVSMSVSVHRDGKVVAGLTAADFELRDNGVVQAIQELSAESVPLDVTLIIDVSGSVTPPQQRAIAAAANTVVSSLRASDRCGLIAFDALLARRIPLQPPPFTVDLGGVAMRPGTSLHDAVALAAMAPAQAERRQLIILLTDGVETTSILDMASLVDVVQRSDARIDVIVASQEALRELQRDRRELTSPMPALSRDGRRMYPIKGVHAVDVVSSLTGGQTLDHAQGDLAAAFLRSVDDFRASYVLRYVASGVPRGGWHDVAVTVKRPGAHVVRARRGYIGSVP
jgi:VWFA-related protein